MYFSSRWVICTCKITDHLQNGKQILGKKKFQLKLSRDF